MFEAHQILQRPSGCLDARFHATKPSWTLRGVTLRAAWSTEIHPERSESNVKPFQVI